uniref:Uncharacterized protein n=1 Tax=Quercus lobata TaxID=97700 RepID=A0A7N2LTJ4_QUELO
MSVSSTENDKGNTSTRSSPTEMDMEEETPSELFEINQDVLRASIVEEHEHEGSLFSFDFQNWNDRVFVAVGAAEESSSSMDALEWTLRHVVTPSTMVLLIHVFPVMRFIPSPWKKISTIPFIFQCFWEIYHMNHAGLVHPIFLKVFVDHFQCPKAQVKAYWLFDREFISNLTLVSGNRMSDKINMSCDDSRNDSKASSETGDGAGICDPRKSQEEEAPSRVS